MADVEKVIDYYIVNGEEVEDPDKNGKGVEVDGVLYREGNQVVVRTNEGVIYEGSVAKVGGLTIARYANLEVLDEFGITHKIPYELIDDDGIKMKVDEEE